MCLTIARVAERELDAALRRVPVVVLLGPRQSGKSTVVRRMAVVRGDAARYLDAGRPADERRLQAAASYLHAVGPGLVVIDDAYRVPRVFEAVREVIDERRARGAPSGHFVLVGGAASELLPHAAPLGDRVAQVQMRPLLADEAGAAGVALDELWLRGGLPASVTVDGAGASVRWRQELIRSCLDRDVRRCAPRLPADKIGRLWSMLAHAQGAPLNRNLLAASLEVSPAAVQRYLALLVELLLVRRLPAWRGDVGMRLVCGWCAPRRSTCVTAGCCTRCWTSETRSACSGIHWPRQAGTGSWSST